MMNDLLRDIALPAISRRGATNALPDPKWLQYSISSPAKNDPRRPSRPPLARAVLVAVVVCGVWWLAVSWGGR